MRDNEKSAPERTCIVCGHPLEPYMRICERCGSIQRPFKTPQRKFPKERFSTCERCGKQIPEGKKLCDECKVLMKKKKPNIFSRFRKMVSSIIRNIVRIFKGNSE